MREALAYVVVGKGRWGTRIHRMLESESRPAGFLLGARRGNGESAGDYESRMAEAFAASAAQAAWLCVPPGEHVPPFIRAAIAAGLHVIVEKPWVYSREETTALLQAAGRARVQTAVDFEYCLLEEVGKWREQLFAREDLTFGGTFHVSVADHAGIPAIENLGSHLLAMREFAAPRSKVSHLSCAYEAVNERRVWLEAAGGGRVSEIDFLGSKEPIVQRFVRRFEASVERSGSEAFPFDFEFADRVRQELQALRP